MEHADPAQFAATSKPPFGIWLLEQIKRDDAVGALAKVAFTDRRWPRGDYKEASKYLNSVSASCEMHDALAEAETDWLAL